jgi:hypothetical protein
LDNCCKHKKEKKKKLYQRSGLNLEFGNRQSVQRPEGTFPRLKVVIFNFLNLILYIEKWNFRVFGAKDRQSKRSSVEMCGECIRFLRVVGLAETDNALARFVQLHHRSGAGPCPA